MVSNSEQSTRIKLDEASTLEPDKLSVCRSYSMYYCMDKYR